MTIKEDMEQQQRELDALHINLHAVRMMKGYKPTDFEVKTAKWIVNVYKDSCVECMDAYNKSKLPANQQVQANNKWWEVLVHGS